MDITYLIIYNSHTGGTIRIPKPVRFHTLPEFKRFLQQSFEIDNPDNLFLLTSFGIKLNYNLINELNDVFVYDKRLFSNEVDGSLLANFEESYIPVEPKRIAFSNASGASEINSNLRTIQSWSRSLTQDCQTLEEESRALIKRINIMFKALSLIFQFGTNFISEIEKNFNNYLNHIKLINYKSLHKNWSDHYGNLGKFPAFKIKDQSINLVTLLEPQRLKDSAAFIGESLPQIVAKFNSMSDIINTVNEDKVKVDKSIESSRNESIGTFKDIAPAQYLESIQKSSRQVTTDLESVSKKSTSILKSTYEQHLNGTIPNVFQNARTLYEHYNSLKSFKKKLLRDSIKISGQIANLQMKMVQVKNDLRILTSPTDTDDYLSFKTINKIKGFEDYLSLTIDLPLLFGFMLIEKRRQFEWYDFYSKGVVSNISEQLTTIIDHEKLFRKIWLKKIGNFLTLLKDEPLAPTLPSIDVTLVGHKVSNFSILYDIEVDRKDIANYLTLLETADSPKNFVELLNKNFKDLIKSTNNMKKVTALISSLGTYTSISNEDKSRIIQKGDAEELDVDLNLVRDLKLRIKKLENLLHQQQYKNLTNWPVTRNNTNHNDNRLSMIMDPKKSPNAVTNPPKTNPTQLLHRRNTTGESPSQSKVLDMSGIDKHLDNIRLRKENGELDKDSRKVKEENSRIVQENKRLVEDFRSKTEELTSLSEVNRSLQEKVIKTENENEVLRKQNETKDSALQDLRDQLDALKRSQKTKDQDHQVQLQKKDQELATFKLDRKLDNKELESLQRKLENKDSKITELQNHLAKFTEISTKSSYEVNELNNALGSLRNELNDTTNMKNDLLSNLSSKEAEFTKERNTFEAEIKGLNVKLDEVNEDYENLMELTQSKHKNTLSLINNLNQVIVTLFGDIKKLIDNNFDYFVEFCLLLESMGLLLIKENMEYKITRVKGLRSKKGGEEDSRILNIDKPTSKVFQEVENSKKWAEKLEDIQDIALSQSSARAVSTDGNDGNEDDEVEKSIERAATLLATFNDIFVDKAAKDHSKFHEYAQIVSFKENVQMQEDSVSSMFFLSAVSKRFKDVEGFAKRQTKENKAKEQEVQRLTSKLSTKIAMNDFHVNDLVLFLPTRIERENEVWDSFQPWAAFNIGAPHYFLKIDKKEDFSNKDWMVGRVKSIVEHKVSAENVGDVTTNPFQLSVGVLWYMVEAEEETK